MKRFFDPSRPLLTPRAIVCAFTRRDIHELMLPGRAVIVFSDADLRRMTEGKGSSVVEPWAPFRPLRHITGTGTIVARAFFGGPNIAALVEELSAFGVSEFVLWGYCGSIAENGRIGDLYLARGALREDGISYHYLEDDNDYVSSDWVDEWMPVIEGEGICAVHIWSTDAIYRETEGKVDSCARRGISGVEMEVASLYAVTRAKGLKAAAFLVVSDLFSGGKWSGGFHGKPFRNGVKKMSRFMNEKVVI